MANLGKVVYLTEAQKNTLFTNGTITVDGVTITYSANDIYVTPQDNPVTDVQVNGSSVVTSGVANVPKASDSAFGVVKVGTGSRGISTVSDILSISNASTSNIKTQSDGYKPITPNHVQDATFYGLATASGDTTQKSSSNAVGVYTEDALSSIHQMLDAPVSVSGSTPSITAKSGVRYICGEVATLTIVVPSSGIIDVLFESGSTPTVLTVTPPTGVTVKYPSWFDPTDLEANATYEISIADGCYAVVSVWD